MLIPSGLECFGCVLTSSLKKILLLRYSIEQVRNCYLGEVVVGEEPVGRRSVELIRTKGSNRRSSHATYTIGCCRRIGSLMRTNNLY